MNPEKVKAIQGILGVKADGIWGDKSKAALAAVTSQGVAHLVTASSFADPADVEGYRRAKAHGATDREAFAQGDNGEGKWGHDTTREDQPMAALPYEVWQGAGKTGGARLAVTYQGKRVEGILGDTMPHERNLGNTAGIDLNPGFQKAFGVKPPFLLTGVTWEWI